MTAMLSLVDYSVDGAASLSYTRLSSDEYFQISSIPMNEQPVLTLSVKRLDQNSRLLSLDALRGFDMFWIAGGDALTTGILSRFPLPTTERLKDQLEHVDWEGFRFYDLIFPLFMFLVGCVIPFSLEKFQERPASAYSRIQRRTALLFLLGVIANGLLKFDFANLRYAGVLQRIAICYGTGAILFVNLKLRGQAIAVAGILLGYWAVLALVPVLGGTAGDFTKEGNLGGHLDRTFLPGKIMQAYYGYGDKEGLLSTIPAVATVLLGALAGRWLKSLRSDRNERDHDLHRTMLRRLRQDGHLLRQRNRRTQRRLEHRRPHRRKPLRKMAFPGLRVSQPDFSKAVGKR